MAVYCFTQLIQPGKRDDAKAIFEDGTSASVGSRHLAAPILVSCQRS
jgi:hypothetical protein